MASRELQLTPFRWSRKLQVLFKWSDPVRAGLYAPLLLPLLFGCSILTEPDLSAAHGYYTLERVDGAPLSIPIEAGDCPREIFFGELTLSPEINGRRPLFTILVSLRLRCDPSRLLFVGDGRLVDDFGEWTIIRSAVQFRSDKAYGTQIVPVEEAGPGVNGPLLTLNLGGRRYTFRRTRVF